MACVVIPIAILSSARAHHDILFRQNLWLISIIIAC